MYEISSRCFPGSIPSGSSHAHNLFSAKKVSKRPIGLLPAGMLPAVKLCSIYSAAIFFETFSLGRIVHLARISRQLQAMSTAGS
jgi:hypothetical protein